MSHWYFWRISILLLRCHCYFRIVVFHLLFSNRLLSSKEILLGNPVYETDTSHDSSGWIVWQKASFCQGPQSTSSVLLPGVWFPRRICGTPVKSEKHRMKGQRFCLFFYSSSLSLISFLSLFFCKNFISHYINSFIFYWFWSYNQKNGWKVKMRWVTINKSVIKLMFHFW